MINRSQKFIFYEFLSNIGHNWTQPHLVLIKSSFYYPFRPLFWLQTSQKKQNGRKEVENVGKNCIWSIKVKTILLECSVMLNYQFEFVGEVIVTSFGHSDEFYEKLLFDRSIYRPMCTHMGHHQLPLSSGKCLYCYSLTWSIFQAFKEGRQVNFRSMAVDVVFKTDGTDAPELKNRRVRNSKSRYFVKFRNVRKQLDFKCLTCEVHLGDKILGKSEPRCRKSAGN